MTHQHHHDHGGEDWRTAVHDVILPEALRGVDLGDVVLEIGPGPGLTTDVLAARTARLTTVELDPEQATSLARRLAGTNVEVVEGDAAALPFVEVARVLVPGGVLVAADGVPAEDSPLFGQLDRHHPLDPVGLPRRLEQAGFVDVEVRLHELGGWVCTARAR